MEQHNGETKAIPFRPISAKFSGLQGLKNFKSRPQSAAGKGIMMLPRSKTKQENKYDAKPKSKAPYLSREELTEQLVAIKNQSNLLKEDNIKLKTRIKFLERDSKKEEFDTDKNHLVTSLKTQLKELQKVLENREAEISELKKTSRITKVQEIEIEMKMYVDECTRLRRMLQETLHQLFLGVMPQDVQKRYIEQSLQLKSLKKDYKELSRLTEDPGLQKSKTRKELSMIKLKKNMINTKEENIRVNEDNQRLLNELNTLRNNLRCPNCGYVFEEIGCKDVNTIAWDIWQAIEHRKLSLNSAWALINPDDFPSISAEHLKQGLEQLGLFLNPAEIQYFFPNAEEAISSENFEEILQKLRPGELISYQEMREVLLHLSYRLQVRRYEFEQLPAIFFPEKRMYHQMELYSLLQQDPVAFSDLQAEMLTKFLFGSSESLNNDECAARMSQLVEPWQVLTEQEELAYDQDLKGIVQGLGEKLFEILKEFDKEDCGFITLQEFYETFKALGVQIDGVMMQYLSLLFYTDQLEFNLVPYRNFYQAYNSTST